MSIPPEPAPEPPKEPVHPPTTPDEWTDGIEEEMTARADSFVRRVHAEQDRIDRWA